MIKILSLLALVAMLMVSCGGDGAQKEGPEQAAAEVTELTIAEFDAGPEQYEGKTLRLTGTVDHVCKHGGKRMFILGETPEERLEIEAGENIAAFDVALEGSDVVVDGMVKVMKMDAAYLDEWEAEVLAAAENAADEVVTEVAEVAHAEGTEDDHGAGEHAEGSMAPGDHHQHENNTEHIDALRKELAESGKEYLSFYSLECVTFEEVEQQH